MPDVDNLRTSRISLHVQNCVSSGTKYLEKNTTSLSTVLINFEKSYVIRMNRTCYIYVVACTERVTSA